MSFASALEGALTFILGSFVPSAIPMKGRWWEDRHNEGVTYVKICSEKATSATNEIEIRLY